MTPWASGAVSCSAAIMAGLAALPARAQAVLPSAPPATFAPPAAPAPRPAPPPAAMAAADAPILESETSDVATLPRGGPHRLYVSSRGGGIAIIDGDTAKIQGTVNSSWAAGFAAAPDQSRYYVAESLWARQNRGERVDLVSVYDGTTLKLLHEIPIPGRLIASGRIPFFSLNAGGSRGYVYDMTPAPSVIVVDLAGKKVLAKVETPGCGLIYPYGDNGFASLCADGTLASVALDARAKAAITHSAAFFDAEKDPVFEESPVHAASGTAWFITYTGMVHPAMLGPKSTLAPAWSLQRAAGMGAATTAPQHETWRPGGRRPFAVHMASGTLYALMHSGKHWTQKAGGTEIWSFDANARKLIRRFELPQAGYAVAVSQDARPQLYIVSEEGWLWVMDPETGRIERNMKDLGRPSLIRATGF